jgi:uncharacterized protein
MPSLGQIRIYPIKSLDGIPLQTIQMTSGGSLVGDREYALVDGQDRFFNAKRTPEIQKLRAQFHWPERLIELAGQYFHLEGDRPRLEAWFSDHFGLALRLIRNTQTGFPDDTEANGPTVISQATLQTVAHWFEISLEESRQRFRCNLEVTGAEPFWEDHLTQNVPFQIGAVQLLGVNPCKRCVVPTREPLTAQATPQFQRQFSEARARTLPPDISDERFRMLYRLSLNTILPNSQAGQVLHCGDSVTLGRQGAPP